MVRKGLGQKNVLSASKKSKNEKQFNHAAQFGPNLTNYYPLYVQRNYFRANTSSKVKYNHTQ